jgi:hypothetical protein
MRRPVNWAPDKGVVIRSWEEMEVKVPDGITVYLVIHFRWTEFIVQRSRDDHAFGPPLPPVDQLVRLFDMAP